MGPQPHRLLTSRFQADCTRPGRPSRRVVVSVIFVGAEFSRQGRSKCDESGVTKRVPSMGPRFLLWCGGLNMIGFVLQSCLSIGPPKVPLGPWEKVDEKRNNERPE